ncbi:MAG: 5'-deoxyadenosine deaminase [Acidobacteriota bacterium]
MSCLLIQRGTLVTMNPRLDILRADLLVRDGCIARIGRIAPRATDLLLDATDCFVLPGLIQTHVHLCQTLMRGSADDLPLLTWLKQRIWPLEAAHDERSLRTSVRLGLTELIRGGTTTILSMETVHGTEIVLEEATRSGIRAVIGKCFMNRGAGVPARLLQSHREGFQETELLLKSWHRRDGGRIQVALAPRFILSCSRDLLEQVRDLAQERELLVHTHAAENREEVELVRRQTGWRNVEAFHRMGLSGKRLCLAHCIWLSALEMRILQRSQTRVLHCPNANLKLGSGIAPIVEMKKLGIAVSLGADGAACNNNLDLFHEMRTAALLQKLRYGPQSMQAADVLKMATIEGARALGQEASIGSLEVGKRADLIIVRRRGAHLSPSLDPFSTLVYSAHSSDVRSSVIDGRLVMKDRELLSLDAEKAIGESKQQWKRLAARAGI